jgi:hypothetical protein
MLQLVQSEPARSVVRTRSPRPMGIVDEVVLALGPRDRIATAIGFVFGGMIPIATFLEAHRLDEHRPLHHQVGAYLVLGGLAYSAKTVFAWARRAFNDRVKAAGFVLLLEGVMVTSHVPALPYVLLALLVAINGIATGCTLIADRAPAPRAVGRAARPRSAAPPPSTTTLRAAESKRRNPPAAVVDIAKSTRPSRRRQTTASSQEPLAFDGSVTRAVSSTPS